MRATTAAVCLLVAFGGSAVRASAEEPNRLHLSDGFRVLRTIETDADFAQALAFSPDSRTLAVGDGMSVRFWDPRTGKEAAEPWQLSGTIKFLAFVDVTTLAVVAAPRTSVSVRQYPQGKELARIDSPEGQAFSCLTTAPGMIAVGIERDGASARLFTGPNWREAWCADLPAKSPPLAIAICPGKKEVLALPRWLGPRALAMADGAEIPGIVSESLKSSTLTHMAASPDGRRVTLGPLERTKEYRGPQDTGIVVIDTRSKSERFIRWASGTALGCAFTPDNKTLVVPCRGQTVRLYEPETGELRSAGKVPCNPNCFAVSPDGRLFAFAGTGSHVVLVDWRSADPRQDPPDTATLNRLWQDLAGDGACGFSAVVELGAAPAQAAQLLGEKLKPVLLAPGAVRALIAGLGSDEFAERETAEAKLAELGEAVEAELRKAAEGDDPERRDRARRLLKALKRPHPDLVRALRAIEVLEYTDTPAGRAVLAKLADGAPSARLTQDAKAALDRLRAHDSKP